VIQCKAATVLELFIVTTIEDPINQLPIRTPSPVTQTRYNTHTHTYIYKYVRTYITSNEIFPLSFKITVIKIFTLSRVSVIIDWVWIGNWIY
jgi:hypothetical protein